MINKATNVNEYLKGIPEKRKAALIKLRKLCKDFLTGYEESLVYKMPAYKKDDVVQVAFASQKNHICFYVLVREVMLSNKEMLKGLNHGRGCIRYSNPDKINFAIIEILLKEIARSSAKV